MVTRKQAAHLAYEWSFSALALAAGAATYEYLGVGVQHYVVFAGLAAITWLLLTWREG